MGKKRVKRRHSRQREYHEQSHEEKKWPICGWEETQYYWSRKLAKGVVKEEFEEVGKG